MEIKNIIFDGEFYYVFHAYEKDDYNDKTGQIRSYTTRKQEQTGEYGKYNPTSKPTLREVYEHIRMRYEVDTNCISFTKSASVATTYNIYDQYVVAKVPKEDFENGIVFDAVEFFLEKVEERLVEIVEQGNYTEYQEDLNGIENAQAISEINFILSKYSAIDKRAIVQSRQYLTQEESLRISKLFAKMKFLDFINLQRGEREKSLLIPEVKDNSRIFRTIGNAYTSEEVVYYGDVPQDQVFECLPEFISMISLLEQAREKNKEPEKREKIQYMINSLMHYVIDGYKLENGKLTNGIDSIELNVTDTDFEYFSNPFISKSEVERNISIGEAFDLLHGEVSFRDYKLQVIAVSLISEAILKRRVYQKMLKGIFPDIDVDSYLENTYSVTSDMSIKQNGRGVQLTDTVNLIINQYGYDLKDEKIRQIIESLERLSSQELLELRNHNGNFEKYKPFISSQMDINDRIVNQSIEKGRLDYFAEAIIEGYDWRGKRSFYYKKSKSVLQAKLLKGIKNEEAFDSLIGMLSEREYTTQQIYAIIINMAINEKIGNIEYSSFMNMTKDEMENVLEENAESLELSVEACNIDVLFGNGRALDELKVKMLSYGVSKELIDEALDKNIYFVDKIINQYRFERKISDSEKGALITALLDIAPLKKGKGYLLDNLFAEMSAKLDLSKQEIYGAIINCAVRNNFIDENGFSYGNLTERPRRYVQNLIGRENDINTKVDEFAIALATGKLSDTVKQDLIRYGLEEEFIDSKENRNVLTAKQIVEGYKFHRELSDQEKGILIYTILNNNQLNKGKGGSIRNLYLSMKKELNLSEQEIFGAMINMGLNGNAYSKESKYNYSIMMHQPKLEVINWIGNEEYLETYVSECTILSTTGILPKEISSRLEEFLDLDSVLEQVTPSNLLAIYEIIENYEFPEGITAKEKSDIYKKFFSYSKSKSGHSIMTLLNLMKSESDLKLNEIYGVMINGAILGRLYKEDSDVKEKDKLYFSTVTNVPYVCLEHIKSNQAALNTVVSKETIFRIVDALPEEMQNELNLLGVDQELVRENNSANVYTVKQIIDETDFGRELEEFEKVAIYNRLLYISRNSTDLYNTFIKALERGTFFSKQQIYGIILNTAINGNAAVKNGSDFKTLFSAPKQAPIRILTGKKKVVTKVDDYLIADATGKVPTHVVRSLEKIGVKEDEYKNINPKNVLYAKYIADNFAEDVADEDRRAIFKGLLAYKILEDEKSEHSIKTVVTNLRNSLRLTERNAQRFLINIAIENPNRKIRFAEYSKLLNSPGGAYKFDRSMVKLTITDMLLLKARSQAQSAEEKEIARKELKQLGVKSEIIDQIEDYNIYIAKELMRKAGCWDNTSDLGKRAVLTKLLEPIVKYRGRTITLSKTLLALETKGFNTEEIAGIMINSAIYQSIFKKNDLAYGSLVFDGEAPYKIEKEILDISSLDVSEYAIKMAIGDILTSEEIDRYKHELIDKGVKKELLEGSLQNVYFLNDLLNNVDTLGLNISEEDKRNLANVILERTQKSNCNFSKYAAELAKRGFSADEIRRIIIKTTLGIPIIDEAQYSFSNLIHNSYRIESLGKLKSKINFNLYSEDFEILKLDNMEESEISGLLEYYDSYNLKNLFNKKSISELYMARKILESSQIGKNSSTEEKRMLLSKMLESSALNKDENYGTNKLCCVIRNLKEIGIQEDCVYDAFISLTLDRKRNEKVSYGDLVRTPIRILNLKKEEFPIYTVLPDKYRVKSKKTKTKKNRTKKITVRQKQDDVDCKGKKTTPNSKPKVRGARKKESKDDVLLVKKRLADMGLEIGRYDYVREENWSTIERIITSCDAIQGLEEKEKIAIIDQLLSVTLKKAKLDNTLKTMRETLGMTEQESYNAIINVAITNNTKFAGYSYSVLLNSPSKISEMDKSCFELEINRDVVTLANIYYGMKVQYKEEEVEKANNEFFGKTSNEQLFKHISPHNICTAVDVVNHAKFVRELSDEEKVQITESILKVKEIQNYPSVPNLTRIYVALLQKGLSKEEAATAIVNTSINQSILITGCSYSKLIHDVNLLVKIDKQYFDTECVTEDTLRKGFSKSSKMDFSENVVAQKCDSARKLGINDELFKIKDHRNIAEAVNIIEEYKFDRDLVDDEKCAILQCLLSCSKLNKGKGYFFSNTIERYKQIGLSEQEAYGALINTACGNFVKGYTMSVILPTPKRILELKKEQIPRVVTDETIKKALSKSGKDIKMVLKGAVGSAQRDRALTDVSAMGELLDDFVQKADVKKE